MMPGLEAELVHFTYLLRQWINVCRIEKAACADSGQAVPLGRIEFGADSDGERVVVMAPQNDGVVFVVCRIQPVLPYDVASAIHVFSRDNDIERAILVFGFGELFSGGEIESFDTGADIFGELLG